jgi:hypothetical protein
MRQVPDPCFEGDTSVLLMAPLLTPRIALKRVLRKVWIDVANLCIFFAPLPLHAFPEPALPPSKTNEFSETAIAEGPHP